MKLHKHIILAKHGCIACKAAGKRTENTTIWPVSDAEPKNREFYQEACARLQEGEEEYFGVYGISPLMKIGTPADLHVFDPMHLLYRGVGLLLLRRFFQSKSR